MNAPSLNDLRNAIPARDLTDEKMNQVRDLLVGDLMRANDARMALLEARMRDLETGLGQRMTSLHQQIEDHVTVLHQRIAVLAADHTADRQSAFDELAKSVLELGSKIRVLSR